ncbi:MAG: hypothetical protein JSV89_15030 [Spirochaetaceae bacterium]|nr:MAG: hypothetical protein JSV89_15030 [Spirochaetaceae bacterium]
MIAHFDEAHRLAYSDAMKSPDPAFSGKAEYSARAQRAIPPAAATRFPWNGIILDLALFIWAGILSFTAPWIRMHMRGIFNWIWVLHCLTFYSVMVGFVLAAPLPPKKLVFNRVTGFIVIAGLVSIFAPIWMFATPLAGGGSYPGLFWNTVAMIAFSIIVCLIVLGKYYSRRIGTAEKVIQFIFPILYLAVSELILYDTARAGGIGVGFVLRAMSLSYIPFRLLMILTPPRNAFEIMTASISFTWFLLILTGIISW